MSTVCLLRRPLRCLATAFRPCSRRGSSAPIGIWSPPPARDSLATANCPGSVRCAGGPGASGCSEPTPNCSGNAGTGTHAGWRAFLANARRCGQGNPRSRNPGTETADKLRNSKIIKNTYWNKIHGILLGH